MPTTFQPFTFSHDDILGQTLRVHAVRATVPAGYLPDRVRLDSTWVTRAGARLFSWFARHDTGSIHLPIVPGDGSQDLRQLEDWLTRHGYRPDDDSALAPFAWVRDTAAAD
jgi:hypothetical protein